MILVSRKLMGGPWSAARLADHRTLRTLLCFGLALTLAACRSIGPGTIQRDRLHYSSAVAESWKEQLLLNIVKTRYGDAPAFLEVSSLVSGYSLETGVSINGEFSPEQLRGDTFLGGELSGKFTDRPTISYVPMTGEKFARSLMSPVPLDALWSVVQGGVPVDFLLELTLQSLEGRRNLGVYGGQLQPAEPQFVEALQLLRALQQAHASESKLIHHGTNTDIRIEFRMPDSTNAALAPELARLKALLGIPAEISSVRIAFTDLASESDVIGMRTRSLMQILSTLGAGVRIPDEHLAEGGVVLVDPARVPSGFVVRSDRDKPDEAFVAVPYAGWWFWIDRRDLPTKTTLAAVTVLFNFLEGGGSKAAPVVTIPAN